MLDRYVRSLVFVVNVLCLCVCFVFGISVFSLFVLECGFCICCVVGLYVICCLWCVMVCIVMVG